MHIVVVMGVKGSKEMRTGGKMTTPLEISSASDSCE